MSETEIFFPPEWAAHKAVWVGWPHLRGEWGAAFEGARLEIADFVRGLSQVSDVRIACGSREAYGSAWFALAPEIAEKRVTLHTLPAGDIWVRDTGPVLGRSGAGAIAALFQFNGWGGKYLMTGDTMTAGAIASVERLPRLRHDFILEGGAIDLDGYGRLLTTRQCLLNPNRNPEWTQARAEAALRAAFAIDQVIWLGDGLLNDHTDGHVDNIARFIGPGRVVCQSPSGLDDPNAAQLAETEALLRAAGLDVALVPSPGRILDEHGDAVPASHMNFLISNGQVFLPIYERVYGVQAIAALETLLPGHKVVGLPARNILSGGGAFHCMTQQIPSIEELI